LINSNERLIVRCNYPYPDYDFLFTLESSENYHLLGIKMAQFIYSMHRVGKVVPPKKHILKDISLSFFPGAKIGVLGLNGSGKSTLLRIMAGLDTDIEGEARALADIRIGYLPQEPALDNEKTVRESVEEAFSEVKNALVRLDQVYAEYAEPEADFDKLAKEQGKLEALIQAQDGHNLENALERAADALRLPEWDRKVGILSGGERRRVALCRLLLEKPDMLLLDEPTNHLDAESVAWLERFLHDYSGTVVAITHDRYFLDNVAGWILELDRGYGIPWEGNYSSWLEQKDARLSQEKSQEKARKKSIAKELEWVRSNPKGRQAKSKARMARFEELNQADFQKRNETNELFIPPGPRLGDQVIDINNLTKSFDGRVLIDDLSFSIPKGAIVGIIGPNGAGKSTLFNMITGSEQPDSGEVIIGESVSLASVDQFRDDMIDSNTVFQEITDDQDILTVGTLQIPSRAYVGRFNFKGSDQQKRIGDLSGGERNRVHLAKLLKAGANVILLDEPTNDLDIETLRALEDALLDFPGCALVISHDRWFLDRIATHILDYRDEGKINFHEGNYTEYEKWLKETIGEAASQPHRIKYKRIS
jgi:ATP-binding cassette ChvD family protein